MRLNVVTTGALAAALLFGCVQGGPTAVVPSATLDFGLAKCGGSAPADQVVKVQNRGSASLRASAALTGSSLFSISGSASLVIPAGAEGTFTISSQAPSASLHAGDAAIGLLTIVTDDARQATTQIPVQLVPQGGSLSVGPSMASFGLAPVGKRALDQPISVKNTGNAPVKIKFVQPEDSQFAIGTDGPITLAPNDEAIVPAQFSPVHTLASVSSARITTDDAVCAGSATSIAFTGRGTNGAFSVTPGDLYFGPGRDGLVNCGATAAPLSFDLTNNGNGAYRWTSALSAGRRSRYRLTPDHGVVGPGEATAVTVTPAAMPATSAIDPELHSESITISTDIAGEVDHVVRLHQTARGAVLQTSAAPVDFGIVPINTNAASPLRLSNKGNARVSLTMTPSSSLFTVQPGVSLAIAPFSTLTAALVFAPGTDSTPHEDSLRYSVSPSDTICAPVPNAVALRGTGGLGRVSLSATALDFGAVDCGTTAAPQTLVVTNNGNLAYNVAAAIDASLGRYSISLDPETGVALPNGGRVRITVTPAAIPQTSALDPELYSETLIVSTNADGDKPHAIPLHQTARGAILTVSAASLAFGGAAVGAASTFQYTIVNSGSGPATVNVVPMSGSGVFTLPQGVTIPAGGSVQSLGAFRPAAAQNYSDIAMVVPVASATCQPVASSISLSGTGTNGSVVDIFPARLNFGLQGYVACGTTGRPQSLRLTNLSAQRINVAVTLGKGGASPFRLSQASVGIDPGNAALITVTPLAIPRIASTFPDFFGDTLTIRTDAASDAPHNVGLHQTALGAVISFERPSLRFGAAAYSGSSSQTLRLYNSGNGPAVIAALLSNDLDFTVDPPWANFGASSWFSGQIIFHPSGVGPRLGTIDIGASSALCAPLPASLGLQGVGL